MTHGTSTQVEIIGQLGSHPGLTTMARVELQGCKIISDQAYEHLLEQQEELTRTRQELASARASAANLVEEAKKLHRLSQQVRITAEHLKPLVRGAEEYQKAAIRRPI